MERLNYTPKKPETDEDKVKPEGELERWELKNWKELYPKLDIGKILVKVADLMDYIYKHYPHTRVGNPKDEEGEWDGSLLLSGFKREIMNLFDPDRESDEHFRRLPEDIKGKIREIKLEDYLKS